LSPTIGRSQADDGDGSEPEAARLFGAHSAGGGRQNPCYLCPVEFQAPGEFAGQDLDKLPVPFNKDLHIASRVSVLARLPTRLKRRRLIPHGSTINASASTSRKGKQRSRTFRE
jgi:hypothetical protein